jgi:hypothetical protein
MNPDPTGGPTHDQWDDQKDSSDLAIARVRRVTFDHPPLNIFGPETIPPAQRDHHGARD